MGMPNELRAAIEKLAAPLSGTTLARAARELTGTYQYAVPGLRPAGAPVQPEPRREGRDLKLTAEQKLAYLVVRVPATFAACAHALREVCERVPEFTPKTLLDLGAGPGTASWAAAEAFPSIENITLAERDAGMIELGQKLAAVSSASALRSAEWLRRDLVSGVPEGNWDLVIASYAVGELTRPAAASFIAQAWKASIGVLLLVEPGTHPGFAVIERARTQLIAAGAELAAPCPHMAACPMTTAPKPGSPVVDSPAVDNKDWCHFSERLERSAAHRRAKGGELAYEDEKFSYIAASRIAPTRARLRIVRHPQRKPGHVILELCTNDGLKRQTIGKSNKEAWRAARKADWGDAWE